MARPERHGFVDSKAVWYEVGGTLPRFRLHLGYESEAVAPAERRTPVGELMLHGSINHVSITVWDLPAALRFFAPLLEFLGYTVGAICHDQRSGHDLTANINVANGTAFNIWQAEPALAGHPFEVYEPGLHHVAFNVERHEQVDAACALVRELGGEVLDGPGEFPLGPGGYYAVYFRGPDRLKFEIVHMPLAERRARERRAGSVEPTRLP